MSRRSKSWDAVIAKQMRDDPDFAAGVVTEALNEGLSVAEALKIGIRCMGAKEVSERSGLDLSKVAAFARGKSRFGQQRINKCLTAFGLEFAPPKLIRTKKKVA